VCERGSRHHHSGCRSWPSPKQDGTSATCELESMAELGQLAKLRHQGILSAAEFAGEERTDPGI